MFNWINRKIAKFAIKRFVKDELDFREKFLKDWTKPSLVHVAIKETLYELQYKIKKCGPIKTIEEDTSKELESLGINQKANETKNETDVSFASIPQASSESDQPSVQEIHEVQR